MKQIIKVGPKHRHVEIPQGYVRVLNGVAQNGDRFCNLQTFGFNLCEADDLGMAFDTFDLLIRKCGYCRGTGYDHLPFNKEGLRTPPCPRCS